MLAYSDGIDDKYDNFKQYKVQPEQTKTEKGATELEFDTAPKIGHPGEPSPPKQKYLLSPQDDHETQ